MTLKCKISALVLLLIFAIPILVFCQDVSGMVKDAELLETTHKETDALKKFQEVLKVQPQNMEALCRSSELCSLIGNRQQEKSAKIIYFNNARRFAETALRINPNNPEANFVMSLAKGRLALVLNGSEKIRAVADIKKYAEITLKNDPSNFKAYHVLGKWHFEISSLNAFEKMGVKFFFGGLPESSFEQSIRYYEKSRSLNPGFALNYLECAKAYQKNRQIDKAIDLLQKLQTLPVKNADDTDIKKEGALLLKDLRDK